MAPLPKVSDTLADMLATYQLNRDAEISALADVLPQYITDHNDKEAFRAVDRQVNQFAKALDRMIAKLTKWHEDALKIESSVENFYGD